MRRLPISLYRLSSPNLHERVFIVRIVHPADWLARLRAERRALRILAQVNALPAAQFEPAVSRTTDQLGV